MYKLIIIKYEDNKNYAEEMASYKERGEYFNRNFDTSGIPKREIATNSLEVILTDEEYKKVKESVITIFGN